MTTSALIATALLVIEYAIKIIAIGVVPENRRPGAAQAWLLLILFLPVIGLPLFLLIGSPYVRGRRHQIQGQANQVIREYTESYPMLPATAEASPAVTSLVGLNRTLASLPCVLGINRGLHADYEESISAITRAVHAAEQYVHVEMYILALDGITADFFSAMGDAVRRGVKVRLLYDHLGSRGYPGFKEMDRRLTEDGIEWHRLMPIDLRRGRWRRPDLRNHRKLVVIDGSVAFMGSQNMIDSSYLKRGNVKVGRHWVDLNIELGGEIVRSIEAVFETDWYTETGQRLGLGRPTAAPEGLVDGPERTAFQLVPSGPGFPTEPNLRLFTSLIHLAQRRLSIVSPYFVPDESLQAAITTAAYRGVAVELFVSEKADQFMVHHAQRSYYGPLLESGVRIYQYPAPTILHAKFFTVDDEAGVIGSSNMDMRSFALDYEISLLGFGGSFVADLQQEAQHYREVCRELTPQEWARRRWRDRYLDNVMRLTAALQ